MQSLVFQASLSNSMKLKKQETDEIETLKFLSTCNYLFYTEASILLPWRIQQFCPMCNFCIISIESAFPYWVG